jgi:hypothetical protein
VWIQYTRTHRSGHVHAQYVSRFHHNEVSIWQNVGDRNAGGQDDFGVDRDGQIRAARRHHLLGLFSQLQLLTVALATAIGVLYNLLKDVTDYLGNTNLAWESQICCIVLAILFSLVCFFSIYLQWRFI